MAIPGGSIIKRSVGLGGGNLPDDVRLVQKLLNAVPIPRGGPTPLLAIDGLCGPKTCGAIRGFQTRNLGAADGRIDPGYRTETALLDLLTTLGALATLLPGLAGATIPSAPVIGGPNSPIRQRFMTICKELLPPKGQLTKGGTGQAGATGCGEFPGRVFTRVPVLYPNQPGAFSVELPGVGRCYLTSPITQWKEFAEAVDRKHAPARTWTVFGGQRPLPGDIYVLGYHDNPAKFRHVGVIVSSEGDSWETADGGQGATGWQSGFRTRYFKPDGEMEGEGDGIKTRLMGWVDLDALFAVAIAAFPANLRG